MKLHLSRHLQQRWQVPYALFIWLLVCISSHVVALGGNNVGELTTRRYFRQLPIESATRPPPPTRQEVCKLNVSNKDGRQQVSDPDVFPYRAVGLLHWNENVTCTATLVASNIIVTAAECVLDLNGKLRDTLEDSPRFNLPQTAQNQSASVTRVHKQSDFWTKWTQNMYVLIELDVDLGSTIGVLHLPTANYFADDAPMNVQLVDFDNYEQASECFQLCKIHFPSESDGSEYILHHDCDVPTKRSPGAPMLIRSTNFDTYIIGIHLNAINSDSSIESHSSFNNTIANQGVLGLFIEPHLSFLLREIESSSSSTVALGNGKVSASEIPMSSSSSFIADVMSTSPPTYEKYRDYDDIGAGANLAPPSAPSSSANTLMKVPHRDIAATTVYFCIGLVCASWFAIIFAAVRRIRSNR